MALLSILLSLFVERFLGSLEELRRFHWFEAYIAWGREHTNASWLAGVGQLLLLFIPPLLAAAVLGTALEGTLLLFGFGYAVLVLLYCYGPRDLEAEVEAFVDACRRGDQESADWYAAALLNGRTPEEGRLSESVMNVVLEQANARIFGVIFWFLLLGPMGALLFRFASLQANAASAQEEPAPYDEAVRRLYAILAWVPARLCALGYAFSGSWASATSAWRDGDGGLADSEGLLRRVGLGALEYTPGEAVEGSSDSIEETLSLVRRTALIWLGALALMTLIGWAG